MTNVVALKWFLKWTSFNNRVKSDVCFRLSPDEQTWQLLFKTHLFSLLSRWWMKHFLPVDVCKAQVGLLANGFITAGGGTGKIHWMDQSNDTSCFFNILSQINQTNTFCDTWFVFINGCWQSVCVFPSSLQTLCSCFISHMSVCRIWIERKTI